MIDRSPGAFVRFGIESLGTGDKPALIVGTIMLSLVIGACAGAVAVRSRVAGDAIFVLFATLGFAAALDAPGSSFVAVLVAALCAAGAGIVSLRALLAAAAALPASTTTDAAAAPAATVASGTSRRRFLALSGGLAAAALVSGNFGRLLLDRVSVAAARA